MSNYLRAFPFDPVKSDESKFVNDIFTTWESGEAISIIPAHYPKSMIDDTIIKIDPTYVIDIDGISTTRTLGIVDDEGLGSVVLTSGTTSDPSPVELSFFSMQESAKSVYEACELNSDDIWLCILPPYYIAGLNIFSRCYFMESKLVFHKSFDVQRVGDEIKDSSITAISLIPSQLEQLLKHDVDLSSLKAILVGGTSFPNKLRELCEELKLPVHSTYGMTETNGGICHDGKLLNNVDARIVDDLIELHTTSLMSGYRHNYPKTISKITSDGWFKTNDRGLLKENILTVLGRNDDVINSGGIKIDPLSIEHLINNHFPDIPGAICSTPHEVYGQCVTLCLTGNPAITLNEIREALKNYLPSTHLPIRLATVSDFPRSNSGKIQRNKLNQSCIIIDEYMKVSGE